MARAHRSAWSYRGNSVVKLVESAGMSFAVTHSIAAAEFGAHGSLSYPMIGSLAPAPRVAIVGSRAATRTHFWRIDEAIDLFAERGITLVSGGALGIDGYAHQRALQRQLPQLVIAACSPQCIYPPDHQRLFAAIAEAPQSGVIFGLGDRQELCRGIFASRNRLVVQSSAGLIVAQAALASGTLRTGQMAMVAKKPVLADLTSPGGKSLIGQGAMAWSFASKEAVRSAVQTFLDHCTGRLGHQDPAGLVVGWPAEIQRLYRHFARLHELCGSIDSFEDPLLALCSLQQAMHLNLVLEVAPYTYKWIGPTLG